MIIGALLLAVVAFLGFVSYRMPRLEQRVFKKIPLADWINILIVPMLAYAGLFLMTRNILLRQNIQVLDIDNLTLSAVGVLFLVYAFVGNSIHFVSKVLSRYLPQNKTMLTVQVNEIFHGHLSHYMSYICSGMVLFILALLELNYPLGDRLSDWSFRILLVSGIVFGVSGSRAIVYTNVWFGGMNKSIFFFVSFLLFTLWIVIRGHDINLWYYPLNVFVLSLFGSMSATFLTRRLSKLLRLSSRRRWRFLTHFLSVS